MGTIKRGILGGFSGKVANVVGSSWKGIAVMKSLPLSVANPRSPLQVANRYRNSKMVLIGQQIGLANIRTLWNMLASQMSGFNLFMKANADALNTDLTPHWGFLYLSKGTYGSLDNTGITVTYNGFTDRYVVDWSACPSAQAYADGDKACAVLVSATGVVLSSNVNVVLQSANVLEFLNVNTALIGAHVLFTILKADGSNVATSVDIVVV